MKFKLGDKVQLNVSNSPEMVVTGIEAGDQVECSWFATDGMTRMHELFPAEALVSWTGSEGRGSKPTP